MSSIVTEEGIVHYQALGHGRPVILLHGWVNSWDVWRHAMRILAERHQRRVYALDFLGFGASAKPNGSGKRHFGVDSYAEMVQQFMERLGIRQAPIVGHSMGGTVALQVALNYPQRAACVVLVGAPVSGNSLNPLLKLAGFRLAGELSWRLPFVNRIVQRWLLGGDTREVQSMIFRDLGRTSKESYFRSIGDLRQTDLRQQLPDLSVPLLGIYGRHDNIVSPENAALLATEAPKAEIRLFEHSRHFPMVDQPDAFMDALMTFLNHEIP